MWMRNVATPVALAGIGMTFYAILRRQQQEGEIPDYISCLRYILSSEPQDSNAQKDREWWEDSFLGLPSPASLIRARCEPAAAQDTAAITSHEENQESNISQFLQRPKSIISKTAFLARVSSFISKIQKLSKESKVQEPENKVVVMPAPKRLSTSETYLKSSIDFIIRREGTYSGLTSSIFFGFPSYFHDPKRQDGIDTLHTSSLTCLPADFPLIGNAVRLTRSLATTGIPTIEFCTNVKTENVSIQEPAAFNDTGSSKSLTCLGLENDQQQIVHRCATCPNLLRVECPDATITSGYQLLESLKMADECSWGLSSCQSQHGDGCRTVQQSCTKFERCKSAMKLQNKPMAEAPEVPDESSTGLLSVSSSAVTVIERKIKKELNDDITSDKVKISIRPSDELAKIFKWRYQQKFHEFANLHFPAKLQQNSFSTGAYLIKQIALLCLRHKELPIKCLKKAAFRIKKGPTQSKACRKADSYCDSKVILFLFFLYALFGVLMLVQEIAINVLTVIPLSDSKMPSNQVQTCLGQWGAFSK